MSLKTEQEILKEFMESNFMVNQICDIIGSTEFAEERLVASAQSLLAEILHDKGLNQSDLAIAMGVSKARVSQIFSQNQNFTLRLLAKAFHALGDEICLGRLSQRIEYKSAHPLIENCDSRSTEDIVSGFDWVEDAVYFGERAISPKHRRTIDLDEVFARHLRKTARAHAGESKAPYEPEDVNWSDNVIPLKARA